jgi:hypothetical protein
MVRIVAVVLSRDEYDLIEDFLAYYSRLLGGASNIVLIDNDSKDSRVLRVYEKYVSQGMVLEQTGPGVVLSLHAQIMTNAIKRHRGRADFIMPLDTDEFLYFPSSTNGVLSIEEARGVLDNHLASLAPNVGVLRYHSVLASVPDSQSVDYVDHRHVRPARSIIHFRDQGWDKLIVRSEAFLAISQGNHHSQIRSGYTVLTSSVLGLLHYHETGAARQRERCIMSMTGYGQLPPPLRFVDDASDQVTNLWHQIEHCDAVIRKQTFGGHRVEQFRVFLRRELVCREYARLTGGRLPDVEVINSVVEDSSVWDDDAVEEGGRRVLASVLLAKHIPIEVSVIGGEGAKELRIEELVLWIPGAVGYGNVRVVTQVTDMLRNI